MRGKLPWTAMRLNASHTAKMIENAHKFEEKSKSEASGPVNSRGFTPKDLELFQASSFQVQDCFKGFDKITTNPAHGELPAWTVRPEVFAKLKRGF